MFAWLGWSRRLAKDFEQTNLSAENFVKLGYISQIIKIYACYDGLVENIWTILFKNLVMANGMSVRYN